MGKNQVPPIPKEVREAGGPRMLDWLVEKDYVGQKDLAAKLASMKQETGHKVLLATREATSALLSYQSQYTRLSPTARERCSWGEVQRRLETNDAHFLKLATAMNEGGVLFGIDVEGNPLISDGGKEPVMKGMSYAETHSAVYGVDDDHRTGYEMFHPNGRMKSDEMIAFETFMGHPFVMPEDRVSLPIASWLYSVDPNALKVAICQWRSHIGHEPRVYIAVALEEGNASTGVRRLLRVHKSLPVFSK